MHRTIIINEEKEPKVQSLRPAGLLVMIFGTFTVIGFLFLLIAIAIQSKICAQFALAFGLPGIFGSIWFADEIKINRPEGETFLWKSV